MGVGQVIKVRFLGDDSDLARAANSAERHTSSLGSTMRKVGKAAAVGLGVGAVFAGKALFDMTKNAVEDEAGQRKLAIGLKNATGATDEQIASVEKWIASQGRALGVTDDEMRPALQRLAESSGSVREAQRQMSIAMDVSAGTGKSLKTVTEAMMKANNGSIAGLSRLGLKTKNAAGETITYEAALRKMADTFGGQAAAKAATLEGKMDRLKLIFDETKETIGAKLIPVATKLADWFLSDGIPMASRFGDKLSELGHKIASVARFIGRHDDAAKVLALTLGALIIVTKLHTATLAVSAAGGLLPYLKATKLVSGALKVWAAVQWAMNAALTANPIGLVIAAVAALVVGLIIAYKKSETFRAIVQGALHAVAVAGLWLWNNALKPAFAGIVKAMQAVGKAGVWLWNNALQPAFQFIVKGVAMILTMWAKMLGALSHVPGFGWAKTAANALQGAADRTNHFADSIRKIPDSHSTKITADTSSARASVDNLRAYIAQFTQQRFTATVTLAQDRPGHNARGTRNWRGGLTWVGEEGPELVNLPRGSQVFSNPASMAMAGGAGGDITIPVTLTLDGEVIHRSLLKVRRRRGRGLDLN